MGRANQMDPNRGVTEEALGVVDEGLGTAYDVVRSVYDSLAGINIVAENIAVITDANDTLEALEDAIALVGSTAADAASALESKNAAAASAVTASTASTNATNRAAEALANTTASGISAAAALASQNAASASQTTATSQAGLATSKAAEALASANTASGHATTATNAATAASTSSGTATGAASTATTKAAEAVASAGTATTKAAEALASAVAAAASQSTASTAATTATGAAATSTTKAGEAVASATTASTGATTATTKAAEASASAIAAAASETAAINAKVLTEAARDATLAAFDSFDDRYLGDHAVAPTTDHDGNALTPGALYFDTSTNPGAMKVYTGVTFGWQAAYVTGDGFAPAIHDHDTRYYQKSEIDTFVAGLQPSIAAGTTAQYWRGDKSWQTLDKSAVGLGNVTNTSDADKPVSTAQQTALNLKLAATHAGTGGAAHADVVAAGASGFMTGAMATKLNGIASGATANSADAVLLARANHTGTQTADTITDGTTNKAYTATEKTKLSGIASGATANSSDATLLNRTNHTGTQAITTATFTTNSRVAGRVTAGSGIVEELTGAQVTALLSTVVAGGAQGVMSGADKTKLDGIATGATANSSDATLLNRTNHTGTQSADTLTNGATNGAFLLTERTKLTGIATGATANSTDATLLNRANHTGTTLITNSTFAATARIAGRVTAGAGVVEELTAAQIRTMINVADGSNVGTITGSFGSGGTTGLTLTGGASSGSVTLTIGGTLALASGGTGSTTAVGARTNLGATSVGHNFFILTNPSAITFPRINADNTVTALSAAAFLTAIGGGAGTITAINGSGGTSGLTLTGGASSGSVTLTIGGTLSTANGGTGITAFGTGVATALGIAIGSAGAFVTFNGAGGTPSAINLTNGTALPIGGITGLGTNVATKLAAANLGASTVGNNFHTMTNPSAITFPRMNADNTVSALNASTFRGAIAAAARGAIGSTGITMTTNRLVGRNTAATGAPEEITLGTGLSFTGTTLNCTVTGGVTTMAANAPLSVNSSTGAVTVTLGAQVLRNVTSGYTSGGSVNVGTSAPGSPAAGDLWLDTTITGGIYGASAWVAFNGTGTVAITGNGNVSSITDNGTGDYTVNFATALASATYATFISVNNDVGSVVGFIRAANSSSAPTTKTTSAVRIGSGANSSNIDSYDMSVVVFAP